MSKATPSAGPRLSEMLALFSTRDDFADCVEIPASAMLPPFHALLVHNHHMTVTVEAFYGDLVDVRIEDQRRVGDVYARKILLALQQTRRIVQYGLVRIHLQYCTPRVQDAILAGTTPLGRVLIENNVMRRIEPTAYIRATPGPALLRWFGLTQPEPCFGRLAVIHCDSQPAIELLELLAPTQPAGTLPSA